MTKNYFSHDYNTAADPKVGALLAEFGGLGYGIFWRIIEMLHIEESHKIQKKKYLFSTLAQQLSTTVEQISTVLKYCAEECELLSQDDNFFWSERVFKNIEAMQETSKNASKAGKASAEARRRLTLVNDRSTRVNKIKEKKTNDQDMYSSDQSNNSNNGDLNNIVPSQKKISRSVSFDDSHFEVAWKNYHPIGKVNKKKCREMWRVAKLDECKDEITKHVESLKSSQNWQNNEFVLHFERYLKQERWKAPVMVEKKKDVTFSPLNNYIKKMLTEQKQQEKEKNEKIINPAS